VLDERQSAGNLDTSISSLGATSNASNYYHNQLYVLFEMQLAHLDRRLTQGLSEALEYSKDANRKLGVNASHILSSLATPI